MTRRLPPGARSRRSTLVWGCLLALGVMPSAACASERVLHVSLYPFIPDAEAAALTLKQGFEKTHPGVRLDITLNANYYSPLPSDNGVLTEDADIHEVDSVFLDDFLAARKLKPLPEALGSNLVPVAREAAWRGGRLVGAPHWICSDFLIYRADEPGLAEARSLDAVERALTPAHAGHGLLLDMKGDATIGELVLAASLARTGSKDAALAALRHPPPGELIAALRRELLLEPAGYGRDLDYDSREGFYARQFARRAGSAFVGYSEKLHDVFDESASSCTHADKCVTPPDIRVQGWPPADRKATRLVWVDMFVIDARIQGQRERDAQEFIRYATALDTYRQLLIPRPGQPPRYLLPARQDAFEDPAIRAAAPLYASFRPLIDHGVAVSAVGLNAALQKQAPAIDAALPASH